MKYTLFQKFFFYEKLLVCRNNNLPTIDFDILQRDLNEVKITNINLTRMHAILLIFSTQRQILY